MFNRFVVYGVCLVVLTGCIYKDEPALEIDYGWNSGVVQPIITKPIQKQASQISSQWVPPSYLERRWTAIIIHHSATSHGNAAIFDKWHREGNYWDGIGYDFVIGNGSNSGDGQVEVTFRWRGQKTGAHCGGTPDNWANKEAIGICLVGNFDNTVPTSRQLQSLVRLVRFLQKRYGIPKSRIFGHRDTPGARPTNCPGKKFPMARLKSML